MDLNPIHVRTLREIARHGSFSRAAESLRLSQPAVSLHMRQLEARCGTALLERVGKRAFATPAGALLLEHAGRAFAELEAAQEALRRLRGVVAGRLRLGTGATASIHLLPPLLRQMRARYPEIELIVVTGNAPDIAAAISDNELDVGIVTLPVVGRQLSITPLRRDPLVAVAPPGRVWRGRGGLTAVELARHPLILYERGGTIRRVIDAWFHRGGGSAPGGHGARQRGSDQETRRRGTRRLGKPGHRGARRGAGGRAPDAAALPGPGASAGAGTPPRQGGDSGAAGVPGRGRRPQ